MPANSTASPKKKNSKKEKNDGTDMVAKFQGDGLSFKGKLYGTADVKAARGDVMCQQALQSMKSALKANSNHKRKIVIRIDINGVTLIDATSNKELARHRVNRISFISKDASDSRSFSYIVGGDEGKHTLYGIKTDKPAEVVLLTFRDLFEAVAQVQQRDAAQNRASRTSSITSGVSADGDSKAAASPSNSVSSQGLPLNIPVTDPVLDPPPVAKENTSPTDNLGIFDVGCGSSKGLEKTSPGVDAMKRTNNAQVALTTSEPVDAKPTNPPSHASDQNWFDVGSSPFATPKTQFESELPQQLETPSSEAVKPAVDNSQTLSAAPNLELSAQSTACFEWGGQVSGEVETEAAPQGEMLGKQGAGGSEESHQRLSPEHTSQEKAVDVGSSLEPLSSPEAPTGLETSGSLEKRESQEKHRISPNTAESPQLERNVPPAETNLPAKDDDVKEVTNEAKGQHNIAGQTPALPPETNPWSTASGTQIDTTDPWATFDDVKGATGGGFSKDIWDNSPFTAKKGEPSPDPFTADTTADLFTSDPFKDADPFGSSNDDTCRKSPFCGDSFSEAFPPGSETTNAVADSKSHFDGDSFSEAFPPANKTAVADSKSHFAGDSFSEAFPTGNETTNAAISHKSPFDGDSFSEAFPPASETTNAVADSKSHFDGGSFSEAFPTGNETTNAAIPCRSPFDGDSFSEASSPASETTNAIADSKSHFDGDSFSEAFPTGNKTTNAAISRKSPFDGDSFSEAFPTIDSDSFFKTEKMFDVGEAGTADSKVTVEPNESGLETINIPVSGEEVVGNTEIVASSILPQSSLSEAVEGGGDAKGEMSSGESEARVESVDTSEDSDSSPGFAPPSCPAPTLPAAVLAKITIEDTPPVVNQIKSPPPTVPARNRAPSTSLPPVPARNFERRTASMTDADKTDGSGPLSPAPSFPPPRLPANTPMPPAIPARRPQRKSETEHSS